MIAMTNAERVKKHRRIKNAKRFAEKHGLHIGACHPKAFIAAMEKDEAERACAKSLFFEQRLIRLFYDELAEYDFMMPNDLDEDQRRDDTQRLQLNQYEDPKMWRWYFLADMMDAWKAAKRRVKE